MVKQILRKKCMVNSMENMHIIIGYYLLVSINMKEVFENPKKLIFLYFLCRLCWMQKMCHLKI